MSFKIEYILLRDELKDCFLRFKEVIIESIFRIRSSRKIIFRILYLSLLFFLLSRSIVAKLNLSLAYILSTPAKEVHIPSQHGRVLSSDGVSLLTIDSPEYELHLDCTCLTNYYGKNQILGQSDVIHSWAVGLSSILRDHSIKEYEELIDGGIKSGKRYLLLSRHISEEQYTDLQYLPEFKSKTSRSGLIFNENFPYHYKYGDLGRRTIGIGRNVDNDSLLYIGLLGTYIDMLKGEKGIKKVKQIDFPRKRIIEKTILQPVNGKDLKTTLSIEYMQASDKALRKHITENINGCVLISNPQGALSSMINLSCGKDGSAREIYNWAIGHLYDAGTFYAPFVSLINEGDNYITINKLFNCNVCDGFEIKGFRRPDVRIIPDAQNLEDRFSVNITPLQLLTVCNALCNEGHVQEPYITEIRRNTCSQEKSCIDSTLVNQYQEYLEHNNNTLSLSGYKYCTETGRIISSTSYAQLQKNGKSIVSIR